MRVVRGIVVLAVVFVLVSPLWAGPKKGGDKKADKKAQKCPVAERLKYLEAVKLTDEQKAKLDAIKKEFVPKFTEAVKKADVLTADQKKARAEAAKAAKKAGKDKKETAEEVKAAVKLTDEQQKKSDEARKELKQLEKDLREKVKGILTKEQKDELKKAHDAKKAK